MKTTNLKNTENLLLEIYTVTVGDISFGVNKKLPVAKKRKSKRNVVHSNKARISSKMTWF